MRIVSDVDASEAGDDFLRVSCQGDEETGVLTVIERVIGETVRSDGTGGWRLRKLFRGLLGSYEAALQLATAYAKHKGVPVVYAETKPN